MRSEADWGFSDKFDVLGNRGNRVRVFRRDVSSVEELEWIILVLDWCERAV